MQTHEQHDNSMLVPHTIGALAMCPTRNAQGNYYFFSLSTGQIINCTHATKLPMPNDMIEHVHEMGTNFWAKVIVKKMKTIDHAFEFYDDDVMPISYQKIDYHMVFDVKIMLKCSKAQYVAGGHQTEPTKDMTFVSIMSRDSIWIAFLVAALNDLEILSADVPRAYLNAKAKGKVSMIGCWQGI